MQGTITLKMDREVLKRARARARERRISVSALVEASVRAALDNEAAAAFRLEDLPPITRSLCRALKGARFDKREYADYLEEKYR